MPTYILLLTSKFMGGNMLPLDIAFSQGLTGVVLLAAIADQQQWSEFSTNYLLLVVKPN